MTREKCMKFTFLCPQIKFDWNTGTLTHFHTFVLLQQSRVVGTGAVCPAKVKIVIL